MTGQKISLLSPVAKVLPTDMFIVARGGGTYKIYGDAIATTPQLNDLTTTVSTKSSKFELENVRSSFASVSASLNTKIGSIVAAYATTTYVNTQDDQVKVYIDDKARTFNSSLSAYISKPTSPQVGNNLIWTGTSWEAQTPIPSTINNYSLDATSVGGVVLFPFEAPPTGYLECNGASLSRTEYPELFAAIGTKFGSVDSDHFNVPDLRGEFIRGWDHGKGIDPGRTLGSLQTDSFKYHSHDVATNVDTHVYTLVDTNVNTGVDLDLDVNVNTNVNTDVNTVVDSIVATDVSTLVDSNIIGTAVTSITSNADTTVSTSVSTDVIGTYDTSSLSASNINLELTYTFPNNLPYITSDNTGVYDLSAGTSLGFYTPEQQTFYTTVSANLSGSLLVQNLSANSSANSTAVTTVTSVGDSILSLSATSTAVSLATSTATSMATSTAVSLASSVATPVWQINATSTAFSLATSTAVSQASSIAIASGGSETRPRNVALLPCIKYTSFIVTSTLTSVLSGVISKPTTASAGQVIGFNGTQWVATDGLPLSGTLNQFLKWDGAKWVAGDYPSNLITHYSTTFVESQSQSFVELLDIPSTAKRITLIFSQLAVNNGNVIKIRLGTALGYVASNYRSVSTAIKNQDQQSLNVADSFAQFGTISYTSVVNSLLSPIAQTVVSKNVDSTITLTKTESNTWVCSNVGSLDVWSIFGGGSVTLPTTLDRINISPNTGQFISGSLTLHWE